MKKKLTIAELEELLSNVRKENDKVYAEYKKMEKKWSKCHKSERKLREQLDVAKLKAMGDELDWKFLLGDAHRKSMPVYDRMSKELYKLGLRSNEVVMDTGQAVIQIMAYIGDENSNELNAKTQNGLRSILRYLEPDKKGEIYIDVLENSLSRNGSYCLMLKKEGRKWMGQIRIHIYHREYDKSEWLPWKDIFPALVKTCPYGDVEDDDDY